MRTLCPVISPSAGAISTLDPKIACCYIVRSQIARLDFLSGAGEAAAFEQRNYVALHQSTLRKVDVLANIAARAHDRTLKTNTTWWEMHGGHIRTVVNWMAENKTFQLIAGFASIAGLIITVWAFHH